MKANNEPCCGTCMAFRATHGEQGECHLAPPQVIFMGFQAPRVAIQGQQPQPIIAGVFPAVAASTFCLQWRGKEPAPLEHREWDQLQLSNDAPCV
jgi:hypothetical protein